MEDQNVSNQKPPTLLDKCKPVLRQIRKPYDILVRTVKKIIISERLYSLYAAKSSLKFDSRMQQLVNMQNSYDVLVMANKRYQNLQNRMTAINSGRRTRPLRHLSGINEKMLILSTLMRKINEKKIVDPPKCINPVANKI